MALKQTNVRLSDSCRDKLEALAMGEGVNLGRAIELLVEHTPLQPVNRFGYVLPKNSRYGAYTTKAAETSVR